MYVNRKGIEIFSEGNVIAIRLLGLFHISLMLIDERNWREAKAGGTCLLAHFENRRFIQATRLSGISE
ncbi:MAG: hypothetical protein WCQ57_16840 [Verrucomicrobiota bacterium]